MYYFLDPDFEIQEDSDLEQEEEQIEEDPEESIDQEQETQIVVVIDPSPGSEGSDGIPAEPVETGARAALTLSASGNSDTIDYSEQIGLILECNIALLIGICFLSIFLVIDRIFRI